MSSPSNDIYSELRELLGTDTLTPDMERVISVMCSYRPHVEIDASYRNQLKRSILASSKKEMTYIRPSWFAWLSWIGTSCAVLIVTFGIVRGLLQPAYDSRDIPGVPPHTPLADSNTLLQDTSHNETIPTPIVMSKTEVTPSPPHTEPTREIAYTTHHNQKSIQVETPT